MNISYNWLNKFLKIDETPQELSLILTDIGLEVEGLEQVQSVPGGLKGVVIGKVLSCEQHPNADRLKVTKVDVGLDNPLDIVCGAPNVDAGQTVVVATVGATLHPLDGEPFAIKKSKIRGEASEGMICAEDELGLGKSHEGIIVLQKEVAPGTPAADYYEVEEDYIYTIGLTPNRADATSHFGVARDIAAYFGKRIELADNAIQGASGSSEIQVEVENPELAPRYAGVLLNGLQVKESPDWLKNKLNSIGVRPINNIVDITNYILHDLGQPLHAFDYSKIAGGKVIVRKAKHEEPFVTLDEVERKLSSEDLVIADAEKPMCLAGVFGGLDSGVTESTTSIFLESAYFNAVSVRKSARRYGLNTDSSFRFERGTDPNMVVTALQEAVKLMTELAGAKVASEVIDQYPTAVENHNITLKYKNIHRIIGEEIPSDKIKQILESLEISILSDKDGELLVSVPPYRVDVRREADVVEEVLRLYGYNKIEISSQIKASLNPSARPDPERVKDTTADLLIANGYREILSNSLTKASLAVDEERSVKVLNALSSDLDTMRQTLVHGVLKAVSYNQKRQKENLKLFEFGHVYYTKEESGYKETERLAIALEGELDPGLWSKDASDASFYNIKSVVEGVLTKLGISSFQVKETSSEDSPFIYGLHYHRGQQELVNFGKLKKSVLKLSDVDSDVFYADFNWTSILKAISKNTIKFKEIAKFPSVRRDLSLLLDEQVDFEALKKIAHKTDRKLLKEVGVFDVYRGDKLPEGKKSYALTFLFLDEEKTLTDKKIDAIIQKLIINFEKELGAVVR